MKLAEKILLAVVIASAVGLTAGAIGLQVVSDGTAPPAEPLEETPEKGKKKKKSGVRRFLAKTKEVIDTMDKAIADVEEEEAGDRAESESENSPQT